MKIYISGKITGTPLELTKLKFQLVEDACLIWKHEPVNPFKLHDSLNKPWEDLMKTDIEALKQCDAIYMLEGWQGSKGARIEHELALKMNLVIKYEEKGHQISHFRISATIEQ